MIPDESSRIIMFAAGERKDGYMLSDRLLQEITALDDGDKQELFSLLLKDPALKEIAPEVTGLRYNYKAARILQEMLDERQAEVSPEVE